MRVVLRVGRRGVVVLPRELREVLDVVEGGEVVAEVSGDRVVLRALKPKVVDVNPKIVEKLLHEESRREKGKYMRVLFSKEIDDGH